jgi:hypothetical protein
MLMAIAFTVLVIGYSNGYLLHKLTAFSIIFLVNFPFIDGYDTSLPISEQLSATLEYPVGWNESVDGSTTEHRQVYGEYTNFWIFNLLSILGIWGFFLTMFMEWPEASSQLRAELQRRREKEL